MFKIRKCNDYFSFSGSSFNSLKSEAHVTVPVEVKFVNRAKCPVQLEWINPQGRRETKKHLAKGRCWRTTSWEGHYWVCTDPKKDGHFFALNYGLHYRVQKTRGARERVVITAGNILICCILSSKEMNSSVPFLREL